MQISHLWTLIDSDSTPIGQGKKVISRGDVRKLLLQWGQYGWTSSSGLAVRRSALLQVLPIPVDRPGGADAYLAATVPFFGEVGAIDEPLMFYRIHNSNQHLSRLPKLSLLLYQRELNERYINQAAAKTGLEQRFDLHEAACTDDTQGFVEVIEEFLADFRLKCSDCRLGRGQYPFV